MGSSSILLALAAGILLLIVAVRLKKSAGPAKVLLKEAEELGWERTDGRQENSAGQELCSLARGNQQVEINIDRGVVWLTSPFHDSYFNNFREVQRWLLLTDPYRSNEL